MFGKAGLQDILRYGQVLVEGVGVGKVYSSGQTDFSAGSWWIGRSESSLLTSDCQVLSLGHKLRIVNSYTTCVSQHVIARILRLDHLYQFSYLVRILLSTVEVILTPIPKKLANTFSPTQIIPQICPASPICPAPSSLIFRWCTAATFMRHCTNSA